MSHPSQRSVVETIVETNATAISTSRVLEVGSFDVNGAVRSLIAPQQYLGIDLIAGPGVDRVARVEDLVDEGLQFNLIICCEVLEHDNNWRKTLDSCWRLTAPGGMLLVTCASTGRPEHGTARTTASDSPGTSAIGSNYYMNIQKSDAELWVGSLDEVGDQVVIYSSFHFDLCVSVVKARLEGEASDCFIIPSKSAILQGLRNVPLSYYLLTRPLWAISQILPERTYQNVAVKYARRLQAVRRALQLRPNL